MTSSNSLGLAEWRKSSRSTGAAENCVEVATDTRIIAIRDSKNPAGGMLKLDSAVWRELRHAIRQGTFDI
ncbi:DUF397 domain-containing protein [Spirillospora sp. NPDC047279]|uniref:DUF397 domain-containing protein n=1 Tax=Spirillospora sp. NPDC047279 TaxID=3155478 RepID=UPI0033CEE53D